MHIHTHTHVHKYYTYKYIHIHAETYINMYHAITDHKYPVYTM